LTSCCIFSSTLLITCVCSFFQFFYSDYSVCIVYYSFFFYCYGAHRHLHSFPTRRSSDLLAEWLRNRRVAANSPSLCPTMFSVMYTGMNLFPLCTARVWPTKSGVMVERRDQVLNTFFSFFSFRAVIFTRSDGSTYGPFLTERPITVWPSRACVRARSVSSMTSSCGAFSSPRPCPTDL